RTGLLVTVEDVTRQEALETTRQKFISNASHELKSPTTGIRVAAENLLDGQLVLPEGESSLRTILRAVDRMTLLLNDIAELSRIETGALHLEPEPIALEAFQEDLLEDLQPQAAALGVRMTPMVPSALQGFTFQADPLRLHQLLGNLLSNALKFSPEGGTVVLSVEREGPWLRWRVRDEGPGIAPTEQARIFERFYRSPSARGVPGTGLGLAIVKHLAGLMNGEVAVSSELGRGSTFTLSLPLVEWKVESTWNAPA
ncbi:MAG TPA: HAMP domain-containing sensor histidine kinase, partial [Holophaga sp.]|nr:HAMP domain-containing sensor histidine kinase [Holophaga sp.]